MEDGRQIKALCRVVDRTKLEIFEVDTETWGTSVLLSDAIEARNSSFLLLPGRGLLCIGGYDSKYHTFLRDTFLISFQGVVQLLPALAHARCGLGLIEHESVLWGFGGRDVRVGVVVEKLRLEGGEWELGREMSTARAYFNPVEYEGEAYLCGGLTSACESYSFSSDSYRALPYQLPETSESLTALTPGGLLVLTGRQITHIDFTQGEMSRHEARVDCVKASCGPVVAGNKLYVVCEGGVWRVDLGTREVALLGS